MSDATILKTGDYSYSESLDGLNQTITFQTAEELDAFLKRGGFGYYESDEAKSNSPFQEADTSVKALLECLKKNEVLFGTHRNIPPPPEGRINLSSLYRDTTQCDSVGLEGEVTLPPNTQAVLTKIPNHQLCDCGGAASGTTHADWCSSLQS